MERWRELASSRDDTAVPAIIVCDVVLCLLSNYWQSAARDAISSAVHAGSRNVPSRPCDPIRWHARLCSCRYEQHVACKQSMSHVRASGNCMTAKKGAEHTQLLQHDVNSALGLQQLVTAYYHSCKRAAVHSAQLHVLHRAPSNCGCLKSRAVDRDHSNTPTVLSLALPAALITRAERSFLHMSCANACVSPSNIQHQHCPIALHNRLP
jgi:hypothetical protein